MAVVSLVALYGENVYAYRDTISPEELYGNSGGTGDGATLMLVLFVLINGGIFLILWLRKKKIQKENIQNLRKLTENSNTPDSLKNLKEISELYSRMKNLHSFFSRLEAEKKEKEINEKGEFFGFVLKDDDMWRHHSGYIVFELRR